jgi:ribA/ribD-fused uncharacterized protein
MANNIIDEFRGKYFFLSNFYVCRMRIGKYSYSTVEHYFQSQKAIHSYDEKYIIDSDSPKEAKRRGRQVLIKENWEIIKKEVMLKALYAKFKIPKMKIKLLNTKDAYLIEGNVWHDNYWGDCRCYRCQKITGKNILGILLMEVRSKIE